MSWTTVYRGYDDQALTAVANPGLVRRAAKLATSAVVDGSGVVTVGGFDVRLDDRGPAHGRCPCPAAGVCVHVLAAAMAVRDRTSDDGPETSTTSPGSSAPGAESAEGDPAPVVDEIVALEPAALCRRAGVAAARRAFRRPTGAPVTLTGNARWVDIAWDDRSVRYVAGAGWDGMVSRTDPDDRSAVHLEALARVFGLRDVAWTRPPAVDAGAEDGPPDRPTRATRALTASVRDEITATVSAGLSHLSPDAAERLASLATEARIVGLPLLGRHTGTGAALLEGLAEHRDDVSETEATSALARVWALSRALDAPDGSFPAEAGEGSADARWARLRGTVRRTFDESGDRLTLHPLGATWWVTPTGARGITLTAWDADAATVRTATAARPAGTDPRFVRSPGTVALWGSTVPRLLAGPFRVDGARTAPDGALSATARSVTCLPGGIDETVLHAVRASLTSGAPGVGFSGVDHPVTLVAVPRFGEVVVDEPTQQLVWSLPDDLVLHLPITADTVHRVDALLALEASRDVRSQVAYVLARRAVVRSRAVWEPVTVVLRRAGGLELFSLDFTDPPRLKNRSLLQRRWDLLSRRWARTPQTPTVARPAVAVVCDDVRDLVVALTATGRLTVSGQQRQRCDDLARRCDDLALGTLAASVRRLAAHTDVEALLRAHHVADRAAALAEAG